MSPAINEKPLTLAGGIPFAEFNHAEAAAMTEALPMVAAYLKSAAQYRREGVSLTSFVDSKLIDEVGHAPFRMSAELKSALDKQDVVIGKYIAAWAND